MKERKYYRFLVECREDPENENYWFKRISMTSPDDRELQLEISTVGKHFPKYLCMMQFDDDDAAVKWFESNYNGY